jgi:hypothetical protein
MRVVIGVLSVLVSAFVLASCRRAPRPTYEYGETVTITSTEAEGSAPAQPSAGAPVTSTTLQPARRGWERRKDW